MEAAKSPAEEAHWVQELQPRSFQLQLRDEGGTAALECSGCSPGLQGDAHGVISLPHSVRARAPPGSIVRGWPEMNPCSGIPGLSLPRWNPCPAAGACSQQIGAASRGDGAAPRPPCGLSWDALGLKSHMRDTKIKITFVLQEAQRHPKPCMGR